MTGVRRSATGTGGATTRWRGGFAWVVAVSPALAWFVQLNVLYLLVPPSCRAGHPWFLVATSALAFAAAAAGTWRSWRRRASTDPSSRLAGLVGSLLGALSLLFILGLGIATVIGDPCR